MLDYELFHSMLISNLDESSDKVLYVCGDRSVKRVLLRNQPDLDEEYVLTVHDIWDCNKLTGLRYKDFVIKVAK